MWKVSVGDLDAQVAIHLRAEHAEGPIWDAESSRLWWVDITAERVHCLDPTSGADTSWPTPGQAGGVVIDSDGCPVLAMPDGLAILDRSTAAVTPCVSIEADRPENRANDAKVDACGRVWVGTMAFDKRPGNAALYRVGDHTVTRVVEGLTISNGPAFDAVGGRLYLADTAPGIVDVFDFDLTTGQLGGRRRFLDFGDKGVWPDGMTVDDDGMLWVALGRAGAVHRYDRAGRIDAVLELPTSNPTSVTFGGLDNGDLYVTTSWFDLGADDRLAQPHAGAIYRFRPGVTGPPSTRYRHGIDAVWLRQPLGRPRTRTSAPPRPLWSRRGGRDGAPMLTDPAGRLPLGPSIAHGGAES
jgi:xylono-1,5-lactonase